MLCACGCFSHSMRKDAEEKKLPPIYRGKWAKASKEEVDAMMATGAPYCYRFRVPAVSVGLRVWTAQLAHLTCVGSGYQRCPHCAWEPGAPQTSPSCNSLQTSPSFSISSSCPAILFKRRVFCAHHQHSGSLRLSPSFPCAVLSSSSLLFLEQGRNDPGHHPR